MTQKSEGEKWLTNANIAPGYGKLARALSQQIDDGIMHPKKAEEIMNRRADHWLEKNGIDPEEVGLQGRGRIKAKKAIAKAVSLTLLPIACGLCGLGVYLLTK
ncbi:MAG: hypothetical protein NZM02_01560 [Patescibacteria group bacterium]|nr:hypothetical protein [Patescibacteria group bacterium]